jgi:hypothetical protein
MSDTPETDGLEFKAQLGMIPPYDTVPAEFARRLERQRDELRQVIRDVHKAFPDLDEFQDRNGRPLKWLADKIQKAKGEA